MTEEPHAVDDLDVPVAGSTVSLLSVRRDLAALAELTSWSTSPSGFVVTAHVITTPEIAQLLEGERAWASAHTQRTNTLVVFEGLASQTRPDQPGSLMLDGVSVIAREHRRVEPRAQVPCDLELRVGQASRGQARVLDLSRGGCRVALSEPGALAVGETAVAELTLADATVVRATCEVLRLDEQRREAVLRFGDMSDADAAALRRSVLAQLSASGGSPFSEGA